MKPSTSRKQLFSLLHVVHANLVIREECLESEECEAACPQFEDGCYADQSYKDGVVDVETCRRRTGNRMCYTMCNRMCNRMCFEMYFGRGDPHFIQAYTPWAMKGITSKLPMIFVNAVCMSGL